MRIALLAPFGLRAKGTARARTLPLARGLARRGHSVAVFIPPYDSVEDAGRRWRDDGVEVDQRQPAAGVAERAVALAAGLAVVRGCRALASRRGPRVQAEGPVGARCDPLLDPAARGPAPPRRRFGRLGRAGRLERPSRRRLLRGSEALLCLAGEVRLFPRRCLDGDQRVPARAGARARRAAAGHVYVLHNGVDAAETLRGRRRRSLVASGASDAVLYTRFAGVRPAT